MAGLNKLQMGVFGRREKKYPPNTYICGIGGFITTKELLAAKMAPPITASDIKNFNIDANNNISFYINLNYGLLTNAFRNSGGAEDWGGGNILTGYIDLDKKYSENLGTVIFDNQDNMPFVKLYCKELISFGFRNSAVRIISYPLATGSFGHSNFIGANGVDRIYLPNVLTGGTIGSVATFRSIKPGCKIYLNKDYDLDATWKAACEYAATNRDAELIPILNSTPPSPISDLTAGTITSTSVVLNFTAPNSLNGISYYEAYLDDGSNNPLQLYTPYRELTAGGQALTGLIPGKTYKIKLTSADIFANGSAMAENTVFSNEITITTPL